MNKHYLIVYQPPGNLACLVASTSGDTVLGKIIFLLYLWDAVVLPMILSAPVDVNFQVTTDSSQKPYQPLKWFRIAISQAGTIWVDGWGFSDR